MNLDKIKKEMLNYQDLFGGKLIGADKINSAKTKEELEFIIQEHHDFLFDCCTDAQSSLAQFKRKLKLDI